LRLLGYAVCCLALGIAGAACSTSSGNVVAMTTARRYEPATVTIKEGDTVTFSNTSEEPHSVTAYEGRIPAGARYFSTGGFSTEEMARDNVSGGLVQKGDAFEVTLTKPGVYEYFCVPHENQGMKGEIVVEG